MFKAERASARRLLVSGCSEVAVAVSWNEPPRSKVSTSIPDSPKCYDSIFIRHLDTSFQPAGADAGKCNLQLLL